MEHPSIASRLARRFNDNHDNHSSNDINWSNIVVLMVLGWARDRGVEWANGSNGSTNGTDAQIVRAAKQTNDYGEQLEGIDLL